MLSKDALLSKAFITEGEMRRKLTRKNNRQVIHIFYALEIAALLSSWQKWSYKGDLVVDRGERLQMT